MFDAAIAAQPSSLCLRRKMPPVAARCRLTPAPDAAAPARAAASDTPDGVFHGMTMLFDGAAESDCFLRGAIPAHVVAAPRRQRSADYAAMSPY